MFLCVPVLLLHTFVCFFRIHLFLRMLLLLARLSVLSDSAQVSSADGTNLLLTTKILKIRAVHLLKRMDLPKSEGWPMPGASTGGTGVCVLGSPPPFFHLANKQRERNPSIPPSSQVQYLVDEAADRGADEGTVWAVRDLLRTTFGGGCS